MDTGATDTAIPFKIAQDLQVEVEAQNVEADTMKGVMLVDQGNAIVEVEGRRRRVPIMIVKDEVQPVIGLTTLEALGLRVNPITRQLEPVRPKLLRLRHVKVSRALP